MIVIIVTAFGAGPGGGGTYALANKVILQALVFGSGFSVTLAAQS